MQFVELRSRLLTGTTTAVPAGIIKVDRVADGSWIASESLECTGG